MHFVVSSKSHVMPVNTELLDSIHKYSDMASFYGLAVDPAGIEKIWKD